MKTSGALMIAVALLVGVSVRAGSAAALSLTSQRLTPYRTCTITATPAGTTAVSDANVRQANPTTNFGATTTYVVSSAAAANQRIYVRFDLAVCSPAIASSAIVRLATLRLYVTAVPAVCRTLDLFPATVAWTEAAITWNNEPFGAAINNPPTASRTGSVTVGTPVGCVNQAAGAYITGATVTTDVAAFVAGGSTNLGWMIRDDAEGSATTRSETFSAKDLGTIAQAPQLVVTYVVVP
ncbi:MAG TPA: DNRLRE domain-containing protein [Candidatus Limnocylindrales bacterium]|nr:DNRLRE domain-containing protein [Candidatus Limnocylindrales bacterium]